MASRQQKVFAGLFIVATVALLVGVVAFIERWNRARGEEYTVHFPADMSVDGLSKGAKVKFKGVPIGRVAEVDLQDGPAGPFAVALLEVETRFTPFLNARTRARLVMGGITGSFSIDLTDMEDSVQDAVAQTRADEEWRAAEPPVIHAEESNLARILERTPEVIQEAHELVARLNGVLVGNEARFSGILAALDVLAAEATPRLLAVLERADQVLDRADERVLARGGALDRAEESFELALERLTRDVSQAAGRVAADVSRTLAATEEPTVQALEAVQAALADIQTLAREMHDVLRGNREAFREMVAELRDASEAVEKLMLELKGNPAALIWGEPAADRRAP